MRRALMAVGIFLVLLGIVSFLVPAIGHVATVLILTAGAGLTVTGTWFLQ